VSAAVLLVLAAGCADNHDAAAASTARTTVTTSTGTTAADRTGSLPPAQTTDPYPGMPLIDHVRWTVNSAGRQLRVYPTPAGRRDLFPGARPRAWQEVVADAPDADTPGMADQFYCHWDWARVVAPNKPSWDLEPWRPAVGYAGTVQALCNPGGPEGN
jgi:hypothetical protein